MTVERIPKRVLRAVGEAARFDLLRLANYTFAEYGETYGVIARRLGWPKKKLRRVLDGRHRLTLRLASDLFWAMGGIALKFSVVPRELEPETVEPEAPSPNPSIQP